MRLIGVCSKCHGKIIGSAPNKGFQRASLQVRAAVSVADCCARVGHAVRANALNVTEQTAHAAEQALDMLRRARCIRIERPIPGGRYFATTPDGRHLHYDAPLTADRATYEVVIRGIALIWNSDPIARTHAIAEFKAPDCLLFVPLNPRDNMNARTEWPNARPRMIETVRDATPDELRAMGYHNLDDPREHGKP